MLLMFELISTHGRLVLAWEYFGLIKCKCWPHDLCSCVCVCGLFLFQGWCCMFHLHAGHYRSFSLCIVAPGGPGAGGFQRPRRCRRTQPFTAPPLVCVCVCGLPSLVSCYPSIQSQPAWLTCRNGRNCSWNQAFRSALLHDGTFKRSPKWEKQLGSFH